MTTPRLYYREKDAPPEYQAQIEDLYKQRRALLEYVKFIEALSPRRIYEENNTRKLEDMKKQKSCQFLHRIMKIDEQIRKLRQQHGGMKRSKSAML